MESGYIYSKAATGGLNMEGRQPPSKPSLSVFKQRKIQTVLPVKVGRCPHLFVRNQAVEELKSPIAA